MNIPHSHYNCNKMDKPMVQDFGCKTLDKYLQTQKPKPTKIKPKSIKTILSWTINMNNTFLISNSITIGFFSG